MSAKDYYKILEISRSATPAEIKKSYRRLALIYHPDKNFGNKIYEAKFKELQEAYRILSDVNKRHDYHHQHHTNYTEKKKDTPPATAQTIFNQIQEFRKKIAVLDPDRMNKLALYQQIQHILSPHNIQLLQHNNDIKMNKRIIDEILFCSRYLPYVFVEKICFQLTALAGSDNHIYQKVYRFSKQVRVQTYWNKYKVLAALLVSILLCVAIYKISDSI